jgi:hypothetical protein
LTCTKTSGNITNKDGYITNYIGGEMFEQLFGSKVIEKICFYLSTNDSCYGSELHKLWKLPLFSIQNALNRLEKQGILVSFTRGKTRLYQWNPRYPFLNEFKAFFSKAYSFLPDDLKKKYYEPIIRKRPRRAGKPM